jgi:hypothetical protein
MGKKKKDAKHIQLMALLPGAKIDNEKEKFQLTSEYLLKLLFST